MMRVMRSLCRAVKGIGLGTNRAGAGGATESSEAARHHLRLLALRQAHWPFGWNKLLIANDHWSLLGEVHRNDRDFFSVNVEPDIELGPVRQGEDADVLALIVVAVVEVPQLGALVLWIPMAKFVAEGIHTFFGSRFFFIAASATKGSVVLALLQSVEKPLGLEKTTALGRAQIKRIRSISLSLFVAFDNEVGPDAFHEFIAEAVHLGKLIARVDVQKWKRQLAGSEGLAREAHHHR